MESKSLKRRRSIDDDSNNNVIQTKVWVNDKLNDLHDAAKMKAVHEKTTQKLFSAAAKSTEFQKVDKMPISLHDQYEITGDGNIALRNIIPDQTNVLEERRSKCCQRSTLIHGTCVNCTFDLCEECGYSCTECKKFICRSCVTLFGQCPERIDTPLCEFCQMYVG